MTVDLSTKYLGLALENPLVLAACPLGYDLDALRAIEDAGVGAVVLPSLFEEQVEFEASQLERLQEVGAGHPEAGGYFPDMVEPPTGPEAYIAHLEAVKATLRVPVVASLNGVTSGGWVEHARRIEQAGADALELNVYLVAADPTISGREIEERYLDVVAAVRDEISIPMAVKVGPYFSSFAHFACRITAVGAEGLVLFNRFLQPDIDLETLTVDNRMVPSNAQELRLRLRWISILRDQIEGSIAASGGAHAAGDVVKLLLVGADVVQLALSLLMRGPGHVAVLTDGLVRWMEDHEIRSVEEMKGSFSRANAPDPTAFERGNYMKALTHFTGEFI